MKAVFVLIAVAACSLFESSQAADILVPQEFATIQEAIQFASDGERVIVAPGTYNESIDFMGKAISVIGEMGPDFTTINGNGAPGFVVTIDNNDAPITLLQGFTVSGGFGSTAGAPGGGIRISDGVATITECILRDNLGFLGGGVYMTHSSVNLQNAQLQNNSALQGGGLYAEFSELNVVDSQFLQNQATQFGGATVINWLTNANIQSSVFQGNSANSFGGAIYANSATLHGQQLLVSDNGEVEESGLNSFTINPIGGGGIYVTSTNGRIVSSRITRNNANFGTGVYVASGGTFELVNTLIADNDQTCQCGLGAVYCNSASPVLTNCTIAGNGGFAGIFTTYNSLPVVENTIIARAMNPLSNQSPTAGNGITSLSFCLLQGQPAATTIEIGNVVMDTEPLLDSAADYVPLAGSSAIDAGNNSAVPVDVTSDLLGNNRFFDDVNTPDSGNGNAPVVDIGAIEFGSQQLLPPSNPTIRARLRRSR